ncbi:hypothetical protein M2273_004012 [Mucilaginibacter lappiensis]|jgi:hypothetical protein
MIQLFKADNQFYHERPFYIEKAAFVLRVYKYLFTLNKKFDTRY